MKTRFDLAEFIRSKCPGYKITGEVLLAYFGSSRDRRRNMRADKWKLSRQMAASGIGTSEVDVTCSVSGLRGHVVGKVTKGAVSRLIR